MPEGFRTLGELLLKTPAQTIHEPSLDAAEEPAPPDNERDRTEAALLRDLRLFRARLGEVVDAAVERILSDIACDVLARELHVAPADVAAIVERALQRYASEMPVRVRVHPDDAASLRCGIPTFADDELLRGDAVIELQDGFVDARLGVRLDSVLRGVMA